MAPLRFGLVGAGAIAGVLAEVVEAVDGARLTRVCDGGSGRARGLARKFGAAFAPDLASLVSADDVDAVIVATPSGHHADAVIAAAGHGKHALVEKPLDVRLERCDAAIAASRRNGTVLAGIFQNRFAPGVMAVREAVESGRLGRLVLVQGTVPWQRSAAYYEADAWRGTWWGDGGGALMNQGIHTVDLLLHLGGPLASVAAEVRTLRHAIDTEDTVAASLVFESGALGALTVTTAAWPGISARVELYGEHGSIVLEDGRIARWLVADDASDGATVAPAPDDGSGASDPLAIGSHLHRRQVEDFVEAVQQGRRPAVPAEEARRAVEAVLAVYGSAREGTRVTLPLAS